MLRPVRVSLNLLRYSEYLDFLTTIFIIHCVCTHFPSKCSTFTCNMHAFGLSKDLCDEFLRKQSVISNLTTGELKSNYSVRYDSLTIFRYRSRQHASWQYQSNVQRNSEMASQLASCININGLNVTVNMTILSILNRSIHQNFNVMLAL